MFSMVSAHECMLAWGGRGRAGEGREGGGIGWGGGGGVEGWREGGEAMVLVCLCV